MNTTTTNTTNTMRTTSISSRVLNVGLWLLQALLAVLFLLHGWLFVAPPAEMVAMMNESIAPAFRVFIGMAELLAAVGLILPGVTHILPRLTVLAAAGLMLVMGSATVFHLFRGETASAVSTAILFVFVTLVATLRWKIAPLTARRRS